MTSIEIFELIKKVERSKTELILVNIENTGFIELPKVDVLGVLNDAYELASLSEFREWLKEIGVRNNQIAEKLGIPDVYFTRMLSGEVRSNKHIGGSIDFIQLSKKIASKLC